MSRTVVRLGSAGLLGLLLAGCAALKPSGDAAPEPSEPASASMTETPSPTEPAAAPVPPVQPPVVTVLAGGGIEAALDTYRRALANGPAPGLASSEAGYYLDVLEARLRQRLAGPDSGMTLERRGRRLLIGLLAQPAFETNSARPRPEIVAALQRLHAAAEPFSQLLISVHGHTDNVGADAVNQRLSERRALAVAGQLVERGIPRQRIVAVGHGAARPVAANDTPEGQARNRRVELWLDLIVND